MQTLKPIWSESENRRFRLRANRFTVSIPSQPAKNLKPLWNARQNACFIAPKPDPVIELHATVREFDDHYLMVSNEDWMD